VWDLFVDSFLYGGIFLRGRRQIFREVMGVYEVRKTRTRVNADGMNVLNKLFVFGFQIGWVDFLVVVSFVIALKKRIWVKVA
jgi:hypothetical protein